MPINSISFTRDFSLAPYMPDSSMTNYTFMFIMERSISTTLDTGSLSNSVLSSTTMCKLDTWDPATTRPCYSMLREICCLLSTSISPITRLLDPSCRLDKAVLCLRKVSVQLRWYTCGLFMFLISSPTKLCRRLLWRPSWLSQFSKCLSPFTTSMGTMALPWALKNSSSTVSPALSTTHLQLHHDQFMLGGGCESLLTYMFLCWSVVLDLLWMCRA